MSDKSGLPVLNCDRCGVCCMHMNTPPFMHDEYERLPQNVRSDYDAVFETWNLGWLAHGNDGVACGWLDTVTRKCRHYEHRPEICRDFDIGNDACLMMRRDAGLDVEP